MWDINFIHLNHNFLTTILSNQLLSTFKVAFLGIIRNNMMAMAAYRYSFHQLIGLFLRYMYRYSMVS